MSIWPSVCHVFYPLSYILVGMNFPITWGYFRPLPILLWIFHCPRHFKSNTDASLLTWTTYFSFEWFIPIAARQSSEFVVNFTAAKVLFYADDTHLFFIQEIKPMSYRHKHSSNCWCISNCINHQVQAGKGINISARTFHLAQGDILKVSTVTSLRKGADGLVS